MTKTDELLEHIAKAQGIARSQGSPWLLYHLDLAHKYATPKKPKGIPMTPKMKKAALAAMVGVPLLLAFWWWHFPTFYNGMLRLGSIIDQC